MKLINNINQIETRNRGRIALFLSVLALGGLASLAKTFEFFSGFIVQVEGQVGGDLVLHVMVAVFLGFSACWAGQEPRGSKDNLVSHQGSKTPKQLAFSELGFNSLQLILIVLSISLVSLDEMSQYFVSTRTFSEQDWFANMFGLLIGISVYQVIVIFQMVIFICRTKSKR